MRTTTPINPAVVNQEFHQLPAPASKTRVRAAGTLRRLGSGRYQARISMGRDENGRQRQVSLGTFSTQREAERALRQSQTDYERHQLPVPSQITLGDYLQEALSVRSVGLSAKTRANYQGTLDRYVAPALGHQQLQQVVPSDIRALYAHLLGQSLSGSVLRQVRVVLTLGFDQAVEDELITRNPARMVRLPKTAAPRQGRALRPTEVGLLLAVAQSHPLYPLIVLTLTTGLRRGEVCALTWRQVDLAVGTILVDQALAVVNGRATLGLPKTANSRRIVHMASETASMLRAHREDQVTRGIPASSDDAVFTTSRGTRPHPDTLSHAIQKFGKLAGLGSVTFHTLRVSYTSLSRRQGVPVEIVSRELGHADARLTLQRYRGTYEDEHAAHVKSLGDLIGQLHLPVHREAM